MTTNYRLLSTVNQLIPTDYLRPVIVQPYFSQSDDHMNFDKTSATSLRLNWQLNYNSDFVKHNIYKNNEPNTTNAKPVTTTTTPYIKGTFETIARILQPYNILVAHKPISTLRQLLTNVKDKDEPNDKQGAVYKIKCCDCQASYIGETGRNLNIQLTEHKWVTKNGYVNNHIAEHYLHTYHRIDWDSAECITYITDYYKRLTLESWFTNLEQTPLNRCQQLPAAYKRLVNWTDKH